MQQELFPKAARENKKIHLGSGLELEIIEGLKPKAKLYRFGLFIKIVELSDKVAKRILVVETVELGANQTKLAKALSISRQTIHNYTEIQKQFGREGLINSYQISTSKSREKQRKIHQEKLSTGNKARQLEIIRKAERERKELEDLKNSQLPLFSTKTAEENITPEEQPFSEVHNWKASRYAGIFVYLICLISGAKWFELIIGYFGNAYKIFMVFILMVGCNIPSIEQLKNIHSREAGLLLGLKKLPSKPKLWEWFYIAADLKKANMLLYDFFRNQMLAGAIGCWSWFIDGHLLPYSGKEKIHYSYNTQRRIPMPGRTNLVTCDMSGRIVDFEIQEGKGKLREYIVTLKKKWQNELSDTPLMVFDREGYGGDFFNTLIEHDIAFVTWDKYVDTAKLAKLDKDLFCDEITVNGKKYNVFEGEKAFSCKLELPENGKVLEPKRTFTVRRIYIWNRSCNRRTCGLAWTGQLKVTTADCARAILNRWGASENTFKHLNNRHPFHYHPGFKVKDSEKQDIANPEIKTLSSRLKRLRNNLNRVVAKFSKAKDVFNKDGSLRRNSAKEKLRTQITTIEAEIAAARKEKNNLSERVDVSTLEDYKSFKQIDNEGKNLFDFVTSSVWNVRKQMVDWLRQYYDQEDELVDLFYAITRCHGWVKSSQTEVRVRLEPIQQPKRRAAQEQFCRKLTSLCAYLPSGKWMIVEVGEKPN